MAQVTRRRFTADEYGQMLRSGILGEDDRVELVDGEIVELRPIGSAHAAQVKRLATLLHRVAADYAIVSVQDPIHLDERSEPQPDLALLRFRDDFYAARHPTPADVLLIVEVSDSSVAYNREVKLPLYAQSGISEVWLIDQAAPGVLEVHTGPSVAGYSHVRRAPGLEMP